MSQSDPRLPSTESQQSAQLRTPTLRLSTSHFELSDMSHPLPSQLSAPVWASPHQGAAANAMLARGTVRYGAQSDSSDITAGNVPQSSASNFQQQIRGGNPIALQPSPLAPGLGNQEDHLVDPAALQSEGHYSGESFSSALSSNTTPNRGWESVSQLNIFHNAHTVDGSAPSTRGYRNSYHPSEAISAMNDSTPFKIAGVQYPKEEGFVIETGGRTDSGWFGASSSLMPRDNCDAVPPADSTLQPGQIIGDSSPSSSSEILHGVSDSTYIGNADVQTDGKGKSKRDASWDGSSRSMSTHTIRHVPLPYDQAQREREFEVLDEETSGAPTRQDRRRVQNRLAQRAFRARSKVNTAEASQHTVDLEYFSNTQAQQIGQMTQVIASLQAENTQLKRVLMDRDRALGFMSPVSEPSQPHQYLSQ